MDAERTPAHATCDRGFLSSEGLGLDGVPFKHPSNQSSCRSPRRPVLPPIEHQSYALENPVGTRPTLLARRPEKHALSAPDLVDAILQVCQGGEYIVERRGLREVHVPHRL